MLKVHTKNLGTLAILCLRGRIVSSEAAALRKAVRALTGLSAVVLDFARVSAIDAGGLGAMLELREQAESQGIEVRLTNVTKPVSRMLEVTRLNSVFKVASGAEVLSAASLGPPVSGMELATCA